MEIVCFNDVITCSLTTKKKTTKNLREREKMKTQNGQLCFVETKEKANVLVVLLHCSFHNVNHKKFQSSGIKKKETITPL